MRRKGKELGSEEREEKHGREWGGSEERGREESTRL